MAACRSTLFPRGGRRKRASIGVHFDQHDDRYARTSEWLDVVDQAWKHDHFQFRGKYYKVDGYWSLQPKPVPRPRPVIYAGGESEAAKNLIATEVRRLRDAR